MSMCKGCEWVVGVVRIGRGWCGAAWSGVEWAPGPWAAGGGREDGLEGGHV